jgi:hypothetical protein
VILSSSCHVMYRVSSNHGSPTSGNNPIESHPLGRRTLPAAGQSRRGVIVMAQRTAMPGVLGTYNIAPTMPWLHITTRNGQFGVDPSYRPPFEVVSVHGSA